MAHLQLEKVVCKKMTFCHWKDWVNTTVSACSSRVSVAVSFVQQYYSECVSHHCCVSILSAGSSWDTYISCVWYSSLLYSVSAFHVSRASMSTVLFTILIAFFTDLALTDLIFRISSDKFVNSLMFKTVLMNSVWWWEQQKLKDLLLHFFILVWVHLLGCNIIRMQYVLNAICIRIADNSAEFLMRDTAEKTSLLFFLMIMMLMLLHCHYHAVYKVLWERSTIQSYRVATTLIYQDVEDETSVSCAEERVSYIL